MWIVISTAVVYIGATTQHKDVEERKRDRNRGSHTGLDQVEAS
jgi:hypothetical protein